ncbi:MAG TPA: 23S rRNA (adenine(2030)-N(6))-methyltransferase RlmJ, partial [Accumulibacter sp.]|nr:23S rRNA (adenine(2030)-N(6))-methyltransferase RlmJ [Accumulibacter sp.]
AGDYALDSAQALKLGEFGDGIGRLWPLRQFPAAVGDYLAVVRAANIDGRLKTYPGSPQLARMTMRADDRLRLFERHGRDVLHLREAISGDRRVMVDQADGFAGLKALLPPPTRRALVLIDPSYEEKGDYERVVQALKDGLQRFSTGVFMLWYPQLTRREAHDLPTRLVRVSQGRWLQVGLRVRTPTPDGYGMHGSGVLVVNPPWTLMATLRETLPFLVQALAADSGAGFTLAGSDE